MNFGVNLLLFSDTVDGDVLDRFGQVKDIGFDGVEVPIFEPGLIDIDAIRRRAEENGLAMTVCGALPPGSRFYGEDHAPREAAARYVRDTVRVAADLGAEIICGPLYKPVGDTDESIPLSEQRAETAKRMADIAAEAQEKGARLALEPLNRFETNLLNTAEQGVEFAELVGSEAAGLLLDTFHMHIEEKDSAAAVRRAGASSFAKATEDSALRSSEGAKGGASGRLAHFHASENDRGVAGSGQVRWREVARALAEVKYDGWVVLESFSQSNEAIRTAVSCWRPFYPSPEEFMREGLGFVRELLTSTFAGASGEEP